MNLRGRRICAGLYSLVVCAGLVVMTGCKDKKDSSPEPSLAYVSLYQASPNAPRLAILVDGRQINAYPFNYADETGYLRFYTGQRNLKLGPFDADNIVIDTMVTFENTHAYSIFIVNPYPNAKILLLNDDTAQPASGKAMVRFLNLSPDTPGVDLDVKDQDTPIFTDQVYRSASEFKEVDALTYDFQVKANGTSDILLDIPDITLQAGWHYTILVRGYTNPPVGNENVLSAQVVVD